MGNIKLLAGVIVGTLVLVFGVAWFFSGEKPAEEIKYDQALVAGDRRNVLVGSNGLPEASGSGETVASASGKTDTERVTIVEFSDLQCPACRNAEPEIAGVLSSYGDRVELIYRHFPIDQIHKNAREAAVWSEFMADRGKFFLFRDMVFERQDEWAEAGEVEKIFREYTMELGVSEEEIERGFERDEYIARINSDVVNARSLGVNSTPTFFVENKKVDTGSLLTTVEEEIAAHN